MTGTCQICGQPAPQGCPWTFCKSCKKTKEAREIVKKDRTFFVNNILKKRKISIIIVTADPLGNIFETCLANIKEHTSKFRYETIIINEVGNEYSYSKSVNMGLRAATGDYIVVMNDDVFVQEGWLDAMLEALDADIGIVGGKMLYPNGKVNLCGGIIVWENNDVRTLHLFLNRDGNDPIVNEGVKEVDYISGALFLIPRLVIDSIGFFDEQFTFNFEETDYCCRIRQKGYKVIFTPRCNAIHLEGASSQHINAYGEENSHDKRVKISKERFVKKWLANHP